MWLPDSNRVNIINDIFGKSKRIREPEPENIVNQIDEDDEDDSSESEEQEDDVSDNSVVQANLSHMPKRIYLQKIGRRRTITPEIVVPENGVVLEVEGGQSPPSFVPYSSIISGEHNTPEDVRGS
jgi:hypothetical protein